MRVLREALPVVTLITLASGCRLQPRADGQLDAGQWTRRCTALLDEAREVMQPIAPAFGQIKVKVASTPWFPGLRFDVRTPDGGYYQGGVAHGRWPCAPGASATTTRPSDHPWRNGPDARVVDLDRVHRLAGDTAWLQADRVPRATQARFRSVYQAAFATCLLEAQQVPTVRAPPGYTCVGEGDRPTVRAAPRGRKLAKR